MKPLADTDLTSLDAASCGDETKLHAPDLETRTQSFIRFRNRSDRELTPIRLDWVGQRQDGRVLKPGETPDLRTLADDPVIVRAPHGGIQLDIKATDQQLRMQASPYDARASTCGGAPQVCETSYVRVYRPTATTWKISPEPSNTRLGSPDPQPVAAELAYTASGPVGFVRDHVLPFRITLTKKP